MRLPLCIVGLFAVALATSACGKGAASPQDAKPHQMQPISRAVFAQNRLWLLQDDGSLASLSPDDSKARVEKAPGKVADICNSAGGLAGLFDDGRGQWTLRQRSSDGWTARSSVSSKGDTLIALACSDDGNRVILTTNRRLVELTGSDSRSVDLRQPLDEPFGIGTALASDATIWLGLNAGEWGGGLRRLALKDGNATPIVRYPPGDPCGGTLNIACDPVNGIVPSPWKADCIVVAVGMVHMMSHGRIVQVCGNEVSRLYFKPLNPQPPYGKTEDGEPSSTIAFFGLARTGDRVWAVGVDGLYRFNGPQEPQFRPLPKFENRGGYWVSFEIPGIALVLTDVNQRRSMSGSVPIMAVR